MRYDACVIGAGADGLAAATMLARAGLKVILVEKSARTGGRFALRDFHPGFRAAPFADSFAAIPFEIFQSLGLARRGIFLAPPQASLALWPDREHWIHPHRASSARSLLDDARQAAERLRVRAARDAEPSRRKPIFARKPAPEPWPDEMHYGAALADLVAGLGDADAAAHVAARCTEGQAVDPFLRGTGLHLLSDGGGNMIVPGLAEALEGAAREAGVEIELGVEASEIRQVKDRIASLALSDGREIEARAVLSTLDLKRTFLSLFAWDTLPKPFARRVGGFRMAGAAARLLVALDRPPQLSPDALRAPIHIAPSLELMAAATASWRAGIAPENPPLTLRVPSALMPSLAPEGKAVLTATLGGIPLRLFDGAWTHERRERLRDAALDAVAHAFRGTREAVLAAELFLPTDIEETLGATDGDLAGGEIALDQMFAMRPGFATPAPRTPMAGLYLAGSSCAAAPLGAWASGAIAAAAIIADLKGGLLK